MADSNRPNGTPAEVARIVQERALEIKTMFADTVHAQNGSQVKTAVQTVQSGANKMPESGAPVTPRK